MGLSTPDYGGRGINNSLVDNATEDYNPLAEEQDEFNSEPFVQKPGSHDADCSCSEDESDYQCNSLEEMSSGNIYGVTPPTNIRGVKRDKSKHQANIQKTSYKQFTELKKAKKLQRNPVIKERYANDPLFCKLGHIDSDDNLDKDFTEDKDKRSMDRRETRKKSMTKTIAHERLAKRSSSDLAAIDTSTVDVPVPQAAAKFDTSGRFSSLNFAGKIPVDSSGRFSPEVDGSVQLSSSPSLDLHYVESSSTSVNIFHHSSSLTDFGAWCEQFIQMGLPSFQSSYLFLLHVFLEVIHEALRLRQEQRPVIDPSFLSIRPLLRECKEVLRGAVIVKQYFQTMVDDVTSEGETNTLKDLEEFDDDVRNMLDVYFTYLQSWMLALQSLPEASLSLKNVLESEWLFTKQICPHVIRGEAEAGKRFR
uniref:Uncharacterized protein LOC111102023 n=1 Tax=Crassostrea virginica TaxID=6565 RepID=A0A8B8AGT7_CRAVI|nr:uncharacterized protein LOC111102023 [Crassostrea virginica]